MQYLKADTATKVVIGPVVAVGDGFTPVTTLAVSSADEAEIMKHDAAAVTDISGNTFAAITAADGYYNLTITAGQLDTEGRITILINDDSLCLPVRHDFMVANANVYDSLHAAATTDYLQSDTIQVGGATEDIATETKQDIIDSNVDAVLLDTGTTIPGLIGTPATDIAADIAAVKVDTAATLVDTGTTIPGTITTLQSDTDDIQTRLDNLGAASGGAIAFAPSSDNTSGAIIDSVVKVWATVAGTFADVAADNGNSHDFTDTTNVIDHVYGFAIGGGRQATAVNFVCNVDGNADEMLLKAYDHIGADWETIKVLPGTGNTGTISATPVLLSKHTGTGAELGNVYIRFDTDSTTPSDLSVSLLLVEAVSIGQTVGYANGAVYVDTLNGVAGTEAFVNGVADNPSNLWASAQTIASAVNLSHFHVANGSSVTLDAATDQKEITGDEYTIALGGRSINNTSINDGLVVTGTFLGYPHILDTGIGTAGITGPGAKLGFCAIRGPVVSDATTYTWVLHDCWGVSTAVSEFDFGAAVAAAQTVYITSYHGPLIISNMDHASDKLYLSGNGTLVISASSTTGTIYLSGQWAVTNNGTTTIVYDGVTTDVAAVLVDTATTIPATITTAQADLDTITGASGVNLLTATQASIDAIETDTTEIGTAGAGLTGLGGMSATMKGQVNTEADTALTDYDGPTNTEMEARTPTAAQLAYIVANAATGLPVTFTTSGGSTTVAVIALVDAASGSSVNDQYNGRLLVFTDGTLKGVVTDITDYVGSTTTATITAIPTAPTASHSARLI